MRPSTSQSDGRHRIARWSILSALIAIVVAVALPAGASAASCPVTPGVFATAWLGGSGNMGAENWTNGTPTGSCDVTIASPGSDVITMTGGFNMKSLVLGGVGSTPQLIISDQSPNTNLDAQPAGITIAAGASVTLTCLPGGCPGGGPDIYSGNSPFTNAGTITVDANTGGGAVVGGVIANTGTLSFQQSASLSGQVTNKGSITVATGATATNSGSSCGSTEPFVKNDTGGTISGVGTGVLSVINFEQGNGSTEDVSIPCGSLKYSGTGGSEVRANGGFTLTGEMQENQALSIFALSGNTNATLGGNFTNKGSITLTCPSPAECSGGAGGGAGFNVNDKDFVNAGNFTVDANSGTGAGLGANFEGTIANTGTINFNQSAYLGGPVTNKGKINIATGKTATSSGSSCGDTGGFVKNDTGGQINATGTGTLSVLNYEQGAGTTSGTLPVQIPCGSLKYSGSGASKVQANGGFNLSGETQTGQELIVSAGGSNTNATLQSNFTNKGSITLTCPEGGCSGGSGGGAGFNVNDKDFVNAGTFTIAAASGTGGGVGANFEGTIVNTGTMQFDQSAYLGGPVTNKGAINLANGKTATSSGSSCGDTGSSVKNDTGGSINATGSGFLSVLNYEQGAGTTSGSAPVRIPCGTLKYSGSGASTVQVNGGGTPMTGNVAAGQTLRLVGGITSAPFTNAGTIVLESASTLSSSTVVNTGTLKGTGTVNGSVENTTGVVSPGASPGKLTLSGNYAQGAGGRLEIEIAGTVTEEFDALAIGGSANLNGTVALIPVDGWQESAAVGDSVAFLTYGGSLAGGFATTTVNPAFDCSKQLTVSSDTGAKALKATVGSASCGTPPVTPPPVVTAPTPPPPTTKTCPKGKKLQKGKCVPKKCPKGKKLKKGRCVKKKKPKARSRALRPQA